MGHVVSGKDELMLDTDHEVRMKLGDGKTYVADLDIEKMRKVDALKIATEEEQGTLVADDFTGMELEELMEVKHQ